MPTDPPAARPHPQSLDTQRSLDFGVAPPPTPPAALPPGAAWRVTLLDGQPVGYVLMRSRRRSIGLRIHDDGLRITAPHTLSQRAVDDALQHRKRWILTHLQRWQQQQAARASQPEPWQDGHSLPYLGQAIVLRLDPAGDTRFAGELQHPAPGDVLWLALPLDATPERIRDTAVAWLQAQARTHLGQRLTHFLARTGLTIRRWRLASARTRWGSCNGHGDIMLNWRLVHFPDSIIDYVIAHELAHLRELNHSPAFWQAVGDILPGYQPARDALRQYDLSLLPPV